MARASVLAPALALVASLCVLAAPARAGLVTVTVQGTILSGSDAYRNSVYFGANGAGNLNGMAASISITYDAAWWVNLAGGTYYTAIHQPGYPAFLGQAGSSPVRSASFTVNGTTLALDVAGPHEVATLQVENPGNDSGLGQYGHDSMSLRGGDARTSWCPNDGQCAEGVGISAYGAVYQDLFGPGGYDPANDYDWTDAGGAALGGNVRLYQNNLCLAGSGWPGADGLCPEGRFNDTATHWVEFLLGGTRLTITHDAGGTGNGGGNGVPEPGTLALLLAAALGAAGARRHR